MALAEQLGDDSWQVVSQLAAADPFLLSRCRTVTIITNQSRLQSSTTPP